MSTLREAAEQARTALNWAADHIPPQGDNCQCPVCLALDALAKALKSPIPDYERGFIDGMSEQARRSVDRAVHAMAKEPQRTSLGLTEIMKLMDKVPKGTFYGMVPGDAMRIWLLAALETEKAHGIKGVKE
jgi:hypothetical protein